MTTHRDSDRDPDSDKISFVSYRDDEIIPDRRPSESGRIELFRRSYGANAPERPREREKRIKFELVDDSAETINKRFGFNPYATTETGRKNGPR